MLEPGSWVGRVVKASVLSTDDHRSRGFEPRTSEAHTCPACPLLRASLRVCKAPKPAMYTSSTSLTGFRLSTDIQQCNSTTTQHTSFHRLGGLSSVQSRGGVSKLLRLSAVPSSHLARKPTSFRRRRRLSSSGRLLLRPCPSTPPAAAYYAPQQPHETAQTPQPGGHRQLGLYV